MTEKPPRTDPIETTVSWIKANPMLLGAGAFVAVIAMSAFVVFTDANTQRTLDDGIAIYDDRDLEVGELRSEQFYQSSYDWRDFMINWHAERYREFVDATDDGLILPDDVIGRGLQNDFIRDYISLVDAGLRRLDDEDAVSLLRAFQSIMAYALREHGGQTCLAFGYSEYEGVPPELRATYIERRENFRARFHQLVGAASLRTDQRITVRDLENDSGLREIIAPYLSEDQLRFHDGEFALDDIPLGFVCQYEIDVLEGLIESDEDQAHNLRVQRLRDIYNPERGTLELRSGTLAD